MLLYCSGGYQRAQCLLYDWAQDYCSLQVQQNMFNYEDILTENE